MHDAGTFWPPALDPDGARLDGHGFHAVIEAPRQTLISGAVEAGLAALRTGLAAQGPYAIFDDDTYAVRLGVDRVLLVSPAIGALREASAWDAAGYASSDLGEALVMITLTGPAAFDVLARGGGVDLRAPAPASGGAAMMRHGEITLIAYRYRDGLRLHVERPRLSYLWELLGAYAEIL